MYVSRQASASQGSACCTELEEKKIPIAVSEVSMIPTTEVNLDQKKADQMVRLMEALEDHDDVQHVWANFDFEESA